jgi:hypothetical protein
MISDAGLSSFDCQLSGPINIYSQWYDSESLPSTLPLNSEDGPRHNSGLFAEQYAGGLGIMACLSPFILPRNAKPQEHA